MDFKILNKPIPPELQFTDFDYKNPESFRAKKKQQQIIQQEKQLAGTTLFNVSLASLQHFKMS